MKILVLKIQDLPISASNWKVSMMNTALFEDCLNFEEHALLKSKTMIV